jgi:hypothetical protein
MPYMPLRRGRYAACCVKGEELLERAKGILIGAREKDATVLPARAHTKATIPENASPIVEVIVGRSKRE